MSTEETEARRTVQGPREPSGSGGSLRGARVTARHIDGGGTSLGWGHLGAGPTFTSTWHVTMVSHSPEARATAALDLGISAFIMTLKL